MGMYVHESRIINTPSLARAVEENMHVVHNLSGLDYVRRRAIPTITHYIIMPFEDGLVNNARSKALEENKIGLEDVLQEKHSVRFNPDTIIMADTTIFPDTIVEYKKALENIKNYLSNIQKERNLGIRRDKVRTKDNELYIDAIHATQIIREIHDDYSKREESNIIILRDSNNEERIEPEQRKSMNIVLDKEHNKQLSSDNLIQYYSALGMIKTLRGYMKEYKKYYMIRNNINIESLEKKIQKDYPLAKGGIIRMLFYPQREIDYRQIYHELAGNPRKTLVPDTGDIDILASIPITMENYYHEKDKSKLRVELNKTKARITRERKSHDSQTQIYNVLFHDNKIYVSIRDILNRMEESKKANTEKIIRLKVDPIMPEPQF